MTEHFLIARATRTTVRDTPLVPEDARYDARRGFWVRNDEPWVLADDVMPLTKKNDIETSEDQKGR